MKGQPLRDLRRNTELLILIELIESPSARLKEIAARLEITVQAVSQYMTAMKKEGLLKEQAGKLRPTRKGMQILQEHFTSLKQEVDATLRRLRVIDTCVAIAGKDVSKGQSVGLVMEDGMLMAYPGSESSSTGAAQEAASEGDDVLIGQLEGIVDMELGELLVIEIPPESEGGSKAADIAKAKGKIEQLSPGLLVAGDIAGASLLSKSTEEFFTIHAPIESSMSALSKGVDVAFCGGKESTDQMLAAVADLKRESGYEIKWRVVKT